ncbi:arginase-like, partial [Trifolium medium]|nr:arginase-like [Trifolium medium]
TLGDGEGVKGVYVSIDVDCLDLGYAQGLSYLESGGLSLRAVLNILQNLQGDIVGGDVVQYNPKRDTIDNTTALVTAKIV